MDSPTEESLEYWRDKATYWKHELDEFTESSHQLEQELEYSLKTREDQIRELRLKLNKQQQDNEILRLKTIKCENEITQLEGRYQAERKEKEDLRKHMRELEQKNDDLERAYRIVSETMTEFERSLNREYERNVMLEVEKEMVEESAQERNQRLMDENRDLKQELKVFQRHPNNNAQAEGAVTSEIQTMSRPRMAADVVATGVQASQDESTTATIASADRLKNGNASPSNTRNAALAIVADLLRRVNLESKLLCSTCKRFRCSCVVDPSNPIPQHTSPIENASSSPGASNWFLERIQQTTSRLNKTIDATLKELKQQPRSTEGSHQVTKTASCDNNIHIK
ncbi:nuclear distribution protein nudE homolog isoform X2 [Phlebotomus argentipes]|uniref:nuclear distribution protein nudE homolog isoform X2 n=1 Tax=Phlebotomus argentipes TaxID=94469 RepID=UPI002892AD4D|nr:nuclear distribution protein nudE homolog isoform X2 [Phlebotomus argentipes]